MRTIPHIRIHATQFLNYYLPYDFYADDDKYIESLQVTHQIESACNSDWISYSARELRIYGHMPEAVFAADAEIAGYQYIPNYEGELQSASRYECKYKVTMNVTDGYSVPASTSFNIVVYNHRPYQYRPLQMKLNHTITEVVLHVGEKFSLDVFKDAFLDYDGGLDALEYKICECGKEEQPGTLLPAWLRVYPEMLLAEIELTKEQFTKMSHTYG